MSLDQSRAFRISVTELAHFCCRQGDVVLGNDRSPTLQQGQEGHQRLQSQRPEAYQREVAVKAHFSGQFCHWTLAGRIDGLMLDGGPLVEEIKTTYCSAQDLPAAQHRLHLAQAKLYSALLCQQHDLDVILVRITYLKLDDDSEYQRESRHTGAELLDFLQGCVVEYSRWLDQYCCYLERRDASLAALEFPFQQYRAGQRALSVALYRDMRDQQRGLYHAPTGLGKTMATLFPALKQLGEGHVKQLWYLTAKNSGHRSVQQALAQFPQRPDLRVLFLQAKDKVCAGCDRTQLNCSPQTGYYDRLPVAREQFQASPSWQESDLQALAAEHRLCPHQLARDLLPWVDLVVADYNYVFDPQARLHDALADSKHIGLLVDEAHNLPDRARAMFSAELHRKSLIHLQQQVTEPALQKRIRALRRHYEATHKNAAPRALPPAFTQLLQATVEPLNDWFSQQNWLLFPEELFEHLMALWRFAQRAQSIADEDVLLYSDQPHRIQIFCTDPAPNLQPLTDSFHSCHFFSGSLLPMDYFQRCIQQLPGMSQLALANPFPPEHQCTLVAPVNTRFQQRNQSMAEIAGYIGQLWQTRPGRYLMAVPSYEYLAALMQQLSGQPQLPLICQPNSNEPVARAEFLQHLLSPRYLAGVIAGGVFAEGIDLQDNKLDGVIIVSTCLPPPSPEREHIKQHFEHSDGRGFDFAYRYPAINRVIQTAGRLIRSEQDTGVLLLMDDRFSQAAYRALLPPHWRPRLLKNSAELPSVLSAFFGTDV
ncbi:ATP-dependent DNA helicase [Ketobacter sp.]|uniref:ATP-dependent DNA helicase n=1 Tax=Ketobacter sp. TaxID=2083498 RepID=UPI0025C17F69|nr:ATP-dependent DNA helicase [Ketobacter sp.]